MITVIIMVMIVMINTDTMIVCPPFRGNCRLCFTWFQPVAGFWLFAAAPHKRLTLCVIPLKSARFLNHSIWTNSWLSGQFFDVTSLILDVIHIFMLLTLCSRDIISLNWHVASTTILIGKSWSHHSLSCHQALYCLTCMSNNMMLWCEKMAKGIVEWQRTILPSLSTAASHDFSIIKRFQVIYHSILTCFKNAFTIGWDFTHHGFHK